MTMGEEFFEGYRIEREPDVGKLYVPNALVYKDGVWSFSAEYEALLAAARDANVDVELVDDTEADGILAGFVLCGVSGAIVASVIWTIVLWLT